MRYDPFIHRIYRQARPYMQRLGLMTAARKVITADIRQNVARLIGLEGFIQPSEVEAVTRKFAFVFICQHGEIEIEAALLAISLKKFLRCNYELIAVVPTPADIWGAPSDKTIELLKSLNVKIQPIVNPIDPSFPHGNKLPCFTIKTDASKIIYLDSDILLIRPFFDDPRFAIPLNVKPTDTKRTVDERNDWPEIYNAVGLQPPSLRHPTTASKFFGFPQYNGGVIGIDTDVNLGEVWECYIQKIRHDARFTSERLWTDQIGLAVAIQHLGVEIDYLDERYNYPLHLKRLYTGITPYFVHYHFPTLIDQEPSLVKLFHQFVDQYSQLTTIIKGKPAWEALLHRKPEPSPIIKKLTQIRRQPEFPELILTGIPQSGASYLSQLLHRYTNCVVVDEPEEIVTHLLRDEMVPWGVGLYYRETRSKIMAGKPIKNKLKNSSVTEETLLHNGFSEYVPLVDNQHFILGTKNTWGYLAHLKRLRRVLPDARVVICVRNPFATIASWKKGFTHHRNADLPPVPIGHAGDPWLTEKHKLMQEKIASEVVLSQKRAMLWHYFAELVLDEAPNAIIVHYEDLVVNPHKITSEILKGYEKGKLREPMRSSKPQYHADELDADDTRAIRAICSQSAAELGIDTSYAY